MVFYHRDQVINNTDFQLASRGAHANKHPGNKASRQLVRQYAAMYVATKKSERGAIARQLYEAHFQDKRIFVIEREYFLRCIQDDQKAAQQGPLRHSSSRRKLSDERVQSVVGANGGSLASILALPSRVFIHTGEAFAIDTVDHLLRDEAKKIRRRRAVANNCTNQEHDEQSRCTSSISLPLNKQIHPTFACVQSTAAAGTRSSSVGTIVSASSVDTTTFHATADQFHPTCPAMSYKRPSHTVLEPNQVAWKSIHARKNQSALMGPEFSQNGLQGLDFHNSQQDLSLWKAYSERITDNTDEDLLKPISSCILDDMWSNEPHSDASSSTEEFFASSSSDEVDEDDLNSLICTTTINDIHHNDGSLDFLDQFSAAAFFDKPEF